jgi:hypothetical protein
MPVLYWSAQFMVFVLLNLLSSSRTGLSFFQSMKKDTKNLEKPSQPTSHGRPDQRRFFAHRTHSYKLLCNWYNISFLILNMWGFSRNLTKLCFPRRFVQAHASCHAQALVKQSNESRWIFPIFCYYHFNFCFIRMVCIISWIYSLWVFSGKPVCLCLIFPIISHFYRNAKPISSHCVTTVGGMARSGIQSYRHIAR